MSYEPLAFFLLSIALGYAGTKWFWTGVFSGTGAIILSIYDAGVYELIVTLFPFVEICSLVFYFVIFMIYFFLSAFGVIIGNNIGGKEN